MEPSPGSSLHARWPSLPFAQQGKRRVRCVWYWAILDREGDGRIVASIPDFGNLAAYGVIEKVAVAHVAIRAVGRRAGGAVCRAHQRRSSAASSGTRVAG